MMESDVNKGSELNSAMGVWMNRWNFLDGKFELFAGLSLNFKEN
jgi:hypothetical protein